MNEAERQAEREERVLACVEALKLADLNYAPQTTELERKVRAQGWEFVLREIPADAIFGLMEKALCGRTTGFAPKADELNRLWLGVEVDIHGNTVERTNRDAYKPYRPAPKALPEPEGDGLGKQAFLFFGQRLRAGLGPVQCRCGQNAMLGHGGWGCAAHFCDFWLPVEETMNAPAAVAPKREARAIEPRGAQTNFEPDIFDDETDDAAVVAELLARTGVAQ